jgi:hypothetical protein
LLLLLPGSEEGLTLGNFLLDFLGHPRLVDLFPRYFFGLSGWQVSSAIFK